MQICKWINYFLKPHNKQLNQYCLNFTIFLPKRKVFKKWFSFGLGRVGSRVNPFLLQVKEIGFELGIFRVGSGFELFCHVYNQAYWYQFFLCSYGLWSSTCWEDTTNSWLMFDVESWLMFVDDVALLPCFAAKIWGLLSRGCEIKEKK